MTGLPNRRRAVPARTVPALTALVLLAATGCGGNLSGGGAGEFPSGPITLVVGAEPGGSTDLIARALAEGADDDLGVAIPVVNTPGANGALAANEVAGQDPDGHNLLILNASLTSITPLAVSEEEAVSVGDFEVITGISRDDYVLVVPASSDIDTLDDLVDQGEDLTFGSTGVGTGSQLAQELLFQQAEVSATHVPFDGGAPTLTAVLGGQVDVAAVQLGEAKEQVEAGELIPLATFAEERSEHMPDVPTAVESGYDVLVSQYRAVAAPKDTPDEVLESLRSAFGTAFETEAYRSFNEDNLFSAHEVEPEQLVEEWDGYREDYAAMVEEYGIELGEEQ
ncbi:tripartite tricarboxylate transporter substrate binding protein [Nocardiopsis mangrovi]|uniref:Tripartite tricarboxylate transporter substrate binding protein n=1 Tax=Nocardiopsis mangrovi TaxID=1179818 RepID=A0ABV9E0K2_9ACTN